MLVERDRQVLARVFENRVMSAAQIGDEFFPNVARQNVVRRLLKLAEYGFLERKIVSPLGARDFPAYSIKPQALEIVRTRYPFRIVKDLCKSDSVEHDIELVNLRKRFRALPSINSYFTENMLQACEDFSGMDSLSAFKEYNTDVALKIRKNGKIIIAGLEFERSEKTVDRYAKKLQSYYADPYTAIIFYVCRNVAIQKVLVRAEISVMAGATPRCFYALLQNVLEPKAKCTFTNIKGDKITLD